MSVVGLELLIEETVKDAVADDFKPYVLLHPPLLPVCKSNCANFLFLFLFILMRIEYRSLVNLSGQLHNRLINGFLYLWVHHLKIDLGLPNQLQDCTLKWSDSSSLNQTGDPDLCLASQ
ncbi:hypothetical protein ZIOFF_074211 [Zingiber officinale]|uniref:Uncharacterized protein n=1 Tax=Zingiber officinale TaxID=94328 RepID=A0A8J5BY59_ZINOF|nr:hypothetical protein ZIOFF_074211 [Zingiber officinale]